jgi:hypothetical protein
MPVDVNKYPENLSYVGMIAAKVGCRAGDLSSGHERWRIYQCAIDMPELWPDLLEAIKVEQDPPIASAVVVHLLEHVPADARISVVGTLRAGKERDFAVARVQELGIIESIRAGGCNAEAIRAEADSWSTWLQLRLAGSATDKIVLAELAKTGRTKRVRSIASAQLRSLG